MKKVLKSEVQIKVLETGLNDWINYKIQSEHNVCTVLKRENKKAAKHRIFDLVDLPKEDQSIIINQASNQTFKKKEDDSSKFDIDESMLILVTNIVTDAMDDEMIPLDQLYKIFGEPEGRTPNQFISSAAFEILEEVLREEYNLKQEEVLKIEDGKVETHSRLALHYLTILCSHIVSKRDHWAKVFEFGQSNDSEESIDEVLEEKELLLKAYFGDSYFQGI